MKIKRWTVYDGIAKEYSSKRFVFYRNAERVRDDIIYGYSLAFYSDIDDSLTPEEISSIKIVELT